MTIVETLKRYIVESLQRDDTARQRFNDSTM